jgi:uncharacterized protein DUF1302
MRARTIAALGAVCATAPSLAGALSDDPTAAESGAGRTMTALLENVRGSGLLRADYFESSRALDDEHGFFGVTAQLKVLPELATNIDSKLEVRITNPAIRHGGDTSGDVLEGYLTFHVERVDIRVGRQIVAWGRADGINPTDNLTPRDYTVLLPFEDDQRFGTTAVKLDSALSPELTLTFYATPFFEPSKVPLPSNVTVIDRLPAQTLSNTEAAIKLNHTGERLDWSVSYFSGFSLLPDVRLVGGTITGPVMELHHDWIRVLGADFARNYGRFGVRGEAAYVDTADHHGDDPEVANPYFYWVLGVDRVFLDELNVNLQFFQRRTRDYQDPTTLADPARRSGALLNAIIDGQRDQTSNGLTFRVSNKWYNDTLEAEIFTVVDFTRRSAFVRPLITYAFSDHWKGTVGAEIYRGGADTQFGSLKSNRGGFAEVRYGF